jgi:hypothetical protein
MQVKVTSAAGTDVWSTVQCPAAMPASDVALYKDAPTPVTLTWSAHLADAECSRHTGWAKKGKYSVTGVALGGVPSQATFTLAAPVAAPPAQPTTSPTASATSSTPPVSSSSSTSPSSRPTGTVKKKHEHAD